MQVATTSSAGASVAGNSNKAALEKVAQQFEAVFLRQMIGAMRSASLAEGIGDSSATQQFRDMADARTADAMASKGAMGIAELLLRQFGDRVGDSPSPSAPDGPTPAPGTLDDAA
ncbi:MAG TPA: flagellar biosynthesis protein FlgI [Sphingobium sp.]|jgi:flagellar protein FlgJ|uniref:rod-binding protein n=1 Tax=unclassified Sphingobium TaxID=2611147 RepID=UPI0007F36C0B|nr:MULTISPECIES: rod-binding protein [unclassified Sphingobium]OAN57679.1 flagellar biosynthesis protein FlgI [Sphingobium sp. TCM1]WIW87669.1 rod-binding protein [Sphingobium sp. V4]HAF41819.1 flagellar biosynthesis protein FlgI [Sphingobium sp.]